MSLPGHDHNLESFAVAKVYGASWNVMVAEVANRLVTCSCTRITIQALLDVPARP